MLKFMKGKLLLAGLLLALCVVFLAACGGKGNQEEMNRPVVTEAQADTKEEKAGQSGSSGVKPLEDVNEIPSDGIITKEQFATVAGENREIRFTGESDEGIHYTWTYNAAKIQNPEDQNLKITFDSEELDDIKKQANNANDALKMTMHGNGLICPPTLTVEIPEAWQSDTGLLLKEQDSRLAKMSDVAIQSKPSKEASLDPSEEGTGSSQDDTEQAVTETKSLTEPVEGSTTFTMTVLSLDGDSYIVGGITDVDKLAAINQQAQAIASANANSGPQTNPGYADAGNGDTVSPYYEDSSDDTSPSYSDDHSGQPADIPADTSNSGGTGGSSSGDSGNGDSDNRGSDISSGSTGSGRSDRSVSGGSDGSVSGGSDGSSSGGSSGGSGNTCTLSINCSTILNNKENLTKGKEEFVPSDGWILKPMTVTFSDGESVHDILQRVCRDQGIHMESSFTPAYNSAYVEGINQLYEFDCGQLSGWMYSVNGWYPNYGCSKYTVSAGDVIGWVYTCDLGKDVGDNSMY